MSGKDRLKLGALILLTFGTCTAMAGSVEDVTLADVSIGTGEVSFSTLDQESEHFLTVSCTNGEVSRHKFKKGENPWFIPLSQNGEIMSDANCSYELRLVRDESLDLEQSVSYIQSGQFQVDRGLIYVDDTSAFDTAEVLQ
ncbi:hypothetical protein F3N42_03270 [Marinihelvus fidelis]|uniref:Uncharacterized protein n=1 Tax=Marinihelvus fidelis TaxID=2613842 RepID=A0A5N0TEC1_9GAMM|nr:hypothetical protein [Marinihelvus fidelis]KAA9133382.1 hypothetical protein F3N42_03270 [Marinihelvus fidelis]